MSEQGSDLHDAVKKAEFERVKGLLENYPHLATNTDSNGATPLHHASNKDITELLVIKSEVNAKNSTGASPLHYAATAGYRDVAEVLLAHGADVNAKDEYGWTPLHKAANNGKGI
jgi:26S proteasome non-ATPase regulatory subunit 10